VPVEGLAGGEDAGCALPQPNRYTASNPISPQHVALRIIFDLCIFFSIALRLDDKGHVEQGIGDASPVIELLEKRETLFVEVCPCSQRMTVFVLVPTASATLA
jgi:hypothetical protein